MDGVLETKVIVPGATRAYGILKYVGTIDGKNGVFGGVELQGPAAGSRGKNSGAVDGVQYFNVSLPMTGLFLPWERLRSANPHLQRHDSFSSRTSSFLSSIEKPEKPSPSPRESAALRLNGGPLSRSESPLHYPAHQSVFLARKRDGISYFPDINTVRPSSRTSSRNSNYGGGNDGAEMAQLRKEVAELREVVKARSAELTERNEILSGLQATVTEIHPLMEEYERDLQAKDNKLAKQKADYDKAREEWRESLLLMLSAQQEAETLYERQITDLRAQLAGASSGDSENSADLSLLRDRVAALELENKELRSAAQKTTTSVGNSSTETLHGNDDDDESEELLLRKKISMLAQDVSSLEFALEETQAKLKAKDTRIVELEIALDDASNKDIDAVLRDLEKVHLDRNPEDAQKLIDDLTKQLAEKLHATGEVDELTRTVASLQKEVAEQKTQLQEKIAEADELRLEIQRAKSLHYDGLKVDELQKTIDDLLHELKMRPTFDELTELQTSLEEVDTLHRREVSSKDKLIEILTEEKEGALQDVQKLKNELMELRKQIHTPKTNVDSQLNKSSSMSGGSLPDPEPWVKNDSLTIYTPLNPVDPSAGRHNWCGLCERSGHNSLNCPYENDIF